jgi:hypothetical protein
LNELRAIADRVEIDALRGEFTDAVMMHDYISELVHLLDGSSQLNYAMYHDLDSTPLAGSAPNAPQGRVDPLARRD